MFCTSLAGYTAQELFDPKVISMEPDFHPRAKTKGLSHLLHKEQEFLKAIKTWHDFEVSEPVISREHFCIRMYSKLSMHNGQHVGIDELIVYQVSNDKIVREQFFYGIPQG